MREIVKLGWKLLLLAAVAGLALGMTNAVTKDAIEEQRIAEANRARQAVLSAAASFEILGEEQDGMDEICRGLDAAGETVGYTARCTVHGYGGPIEVTVGAGQGGVVWRAVCRPDRACGADKGRRGGRRGQFRDDQLQRRDVGGERRM